MIVISREISANIDLVVIVVLNKLNLNFSMKKITLHKFVIF